MAFYLSQYQLTVAEARSLRLTDAYSMHRVVYDLFEDTREGSRDVSSGILFADKGMQHGLRTMLILSNRPPQNICRGSLNVRELHNGYLGHSSYTFEIIINPVRRENASRRVVPVRGRDAIIEWFVQKAPSWGFSVRRVDVMDVFVDTFPKANEKGPATATIAKARLTGLLDVAERSAFIHAACNGIGRAKAFGCGLLQIVPCY